MSRSSGRERGSMPVVALVAVAAVGVGLSVYAGAVDASLDTGRDDTTAETAAERAAAALAPAGIAHPDRLPTARSALPGTFRANLTLRSAGEMWRDGPAPPAKVDDGRRGERATVPVQVRVAPGRVHTGRLTVVVWQ